MANPLAAVRNVPKRQWVRYRFVLIVLAPVMALFIYLRVVPTGQAMLMSLFDWELIKPAEKFVGLDNYVNLLSDENFILAFTNTTIFAVATTVFSVLIALLIAALLSRFVTGRLGGLHRAALLRPGARAHGPGHARVARDLQLPARHPERGAGRRGHRAGSPGSPTRPWPSSPS